MAAPIHPNTEPHTRKTRRQISESLKKYHAQTRRAREIAAALEAHGVVVAAEHQS